MDCLLLTNAIMKHYVWQKELLWRRSVGGTQGHPLGPTGGTKNRNTTQSIIMPKPRPHELNFTPTYLVVHLTKSMWFVFSLFITKQHPKASSLLPHFF